VSSKPHGRDCPDRCSQCRTDVRARKVEQLGELILIDGEVARPIAEPAHGPQFKHIKRGKP